MPNDTLSYNNLVSDYNLMENELTASRDSLGIEIKSRQGVEATLKECKEEKVIIKRKTFIGSLKRTSKDILIGIAIGIISTTLF
jgi:hypothetical protein